MKLFCRDDIRRLEQAAESGGVALSQMMEQAGLAVAEETENLCRPISGKEIVILCGNGNNGGDGFVCARHLAQKGAHCTVLLVQGEPKAELARNVFIQMPDTVECLCTQHQGEQARTAIKGADFIIDAVFGFSFRGELSGDGALYIQLANQRDCGRLAVDLPSGAHCDTGRVSPETFRADVTVTFTAKKPANCSYPAKEYCGRTKVCQVGVPQALLEGAETGYFETDSEYPRIYLKEPDVQSNKGSLGRLLLVCGSYGMTGACVMAARGALRCGVGLLQIVVDKKMYPIIAQAVPEAVFVIVDMESQREESEKKLFEALRASSACLIGCGLGEMAEVLSPLIFAHSQGPLVVDADAINFAARRPGALESVQGPMILTPHPGEMARLCADTINEIQGDRLGAARVKARETGAVVALKGAATVIAGPDGRCAVNPTGNPGMAKGGSGDVLAGMIASFAAQGIAPFEAAVTGVYIHGLAGDLCRERLTSRAMLPTDLYEALPQALSEFTDRI